MMYPYDETVQKIDAICQHEILFGLNLLDSPLRGMVRLLLRRPLRRFAVFLTEADQKVVNGHLDACGKFMLDHLATTCAIRGAENIPQQGPLLLTANHPGGLEILATLAQLHRPDVYMVSLEQPILRAMPNASSHIIFLGKDAISRAENIRKIVSLLQAGCAVLIFPAGQMEPDPAATPGALEFLENWSDSPGLFLSRVPQTRLIPIAVSGIIGQRAIHSWLARRQSSLKKRQRVASFLQIVMQNIRKDYWPINIQVLIGSPMQAEQIDPSLEPRALARGVRLQIHALLQTLHPLPYTEPFIT